MLHVNFNTYNNYVTDSLYQWDVNQDLIINGLNLSVAPDIHFANASMNGAIVKHSTLENGVISVRIPNSLLQSALTIKAYVGVYEGETFKVIETIEIPVIARVKPLDYTLEDSDEEIYSFNKLENLVRDAIGKTDEAINRADELKATAERLLSKLDSTHPVGSWYWSDDPISPAELFGGTWEQVFNRTLVGAGDIYAVGEMGGEATHTLTVDEMPSHTHNMRYSYDSSSKQWLEGYLYMPEKADDAYSTSASGDSNTNVTIQSTGGGKAHNNMQPYYATYMWKRIA